MTYNFINNLDSSGIFILKKFIPENLVESLVKPIQNSILFHRKFQKEIGREIIVEGIASNVLIDDKSYIDLLCYLIDNKFIQYLENEFFNSKCILNSFSAIVNLPNNSNFSSHIHRDIRFYSGSFPMMLNCLLMIDDFTVDNGATYLLPDSHKVEQKPTEIEFYNNSIQAIGKKGDLLIFNSNVWHCAALNTSTKERKALPFTISKSFMKPLFDYPRALGYDALNSYSNDLKQFLGFFSRVPSSLEEWYQTDEKRFYKKNQD
jgi:ectoine hydroxylase-related dioxygenase (phytanoyl-CoA dioxygenase family)